MDALEGPVCDECIERLVCAGLAVLADSQDRRDPVWLSMDDVDWASLAEPGQADGVLALVRSRGAEREAIAHARAERSALSS
jgi:hypothetical protein